MIPRIQASFKMHSMLLLLLLLLLLGSQSSFAFSPSAHRTVMQSLAFTSRTGQTHQGLPSFRKQSSRLEMSVEISAALSALDSFYQTQPYQAAFLTCSVKASAADWVVQNRQEHDNSVDIRRNLAFVVYGGIYQGVFQQFLYNTLFPTWFGTDTTLFSVLEQVAVDMTVLTPFLCLPVAYLVKASMDAESSVREGLEKYWTHVQQEGLLQKYWMLWVPVQTLTFGVVPQHLRIVFIAAVSFVWLMILSSISSSSSSSTAAESQKE